jgi:hypothetical protein
LERSRALYNVSFGKRPEAAVWYIARLSCYGDGDAKTATTAATAATMRRETAAATMRRDTAVNARGYKLLCSGGCLWHQFTVSWCFWLNYPVV